MAAQAEYTEVMLALLEVLTLLAQMVIMEGTEDTPNTTKAAAVEVGLLAIVAREAKVDQETTKMDTMDLVVAEEAEQAKQSAALKIMEAAELEFMALAKVALQDMDLAVVAGASHAQLTVKVVLEETMAHQAVTEEFMVAVAVEQKTTPVPKEVQAELVQQD